MGILGALLGGGLSGSGGAAAPSGSTTGSQNITVGGISWITLAIGGGIVLVLLVVAAILFSGKRK